VFLETTLRERERETLRTELNTVILPEQVSEELVFLEFEGPFAGI